MNLFFSSIIVYRVAQLHTISICRCHLELRRRLTGSTEQTREGQFGPFLSPDRQRISSAHGDNGEHYRPAQPSPRTPSAWPPIAIKKLQLKFLMLPAQPICSVHPLRRRLSSRHLVGPPSAPTPPPPFPQSTRLIFILFNQRPKT